jgi:hypothetical protein
MLTDALYGRSRKGAHKLLSAAGLHASLTDPEFVEGVGRRHIKSKLALAWAFKAAQGAGEATRTVHALLSAGAVNVFSSTAIEALHDGVRAWSPGADARLVAGIVSELDNAHAAAMFLRLYLDHPRSVYASNAAGAVALLRTVALSPDFADVVASAAHSDARGAREFLVELGQPWAAHPDVAAAVHAAALGDVNDSSADEAGNLAGFVTEGDGDHDLRDSDFESDASGDGDEHGDGHVASGGLGIARAAAVEAAAERVTARLVHLRKRRLAARKSIVSSGSSGGSASGSDAEREASAGSSGQPALKRRRLVAPGAGARVPRAIAKYVSDEAGVGASSDSDGDSDGGSDAALEIKGAAAGRARSRGGGGGRRAGNVKATAAAAASGAAASDRGKNGKRRARG